VLPEGFPEKHRDAVARAADLCSVKKHIFDPPAFEVRTRSADEPEGAAAGLSTGAAASGSEVAFGR
jgi:hypothetical protein